MVIGDRYALEEVIGAGGSGTVYRAVDRVMGRAVAIKVFHDRDEEAMARFQREARVAAQLRIPDVVAILDFGWDGDRAYIVMELLEGKTLAEVMDAAAMPRARALSIVRRLTAALAQMHSRGIVHRDVTPSNVFLTDDGRVVLSDFGLAAVENRDSRTTHTRTGMILGTPRYMAPEALYGRPLDASVDVYAVGVILYELLLGRWPYPANDSSSSMEQIQAQLGSPVPPRSVEPAFAPELEAVILKALERDPSARFPTAQELLEAFDAAIGAKGWTLRQNLSSGGSWSAARGSGDGDDDEPRTNADPGTLSAAPVSAPSAAPPVPAMPVPAMPVDGEPKPSPPGAAMSEPAMPAATPAMPEPATTPRMPGARRCPHCGAAVPMNAPACGTCSRPMPPMQGAPGNQPAKVMFSYAAPVIGQPPGAARPGAARPGAARPGGPQAPAIQAPARSVPSQPAPVMRVPVTSVPRPPKPPSAASAMPGGAMPKPAQPGTIAPELAMSEPAMPGGAMLKPAQPGTATHGPAIDERPVLAVSRTGIPVRRLRGGLGFWGGGLLAIVVLGLVVGLSVATVTRGSSGSAADVDTLIVGLIVGGIALGVVAVLVNRRPTRREDDVAPRASVPSPEVIGPAVARPRTPSPRQHASEPSRRTVMGGATQVFAPLDDPELAVHRDTLGELLVVEGPLFGARYPLTGTTTLGKDPLCEIVFDEPYVSRRHARIGVEAARVFLEDLGSSNGTLLNDRQVERVFLGNGDRITIGKTVLLYSGPAAAGRLQDLAARWETLSASVARMIDGESFVAASRKLAYGLLREAIGYRIDREVPLHRGFVGFVVDAPTLWIRQRRFALIFVALHDERGDVLQELDEFLEAGQVYEHLVVAIPAAGPGSAPPSPATYRGFMAQSIHRFDLVVLDRSAVEGLVRANTAEQFLQIVLEQGLVPAALSPYVLRGPVPEHMFFGRGRELKVVAEGLATSSFAVVAGRRMGKSSFLQRLLRMLQSDPRYHTLHINCEARDTAARFLDAFESDGEPGGDADAFSRRVARLRAREHGRTIVLLVDEVDALLDHELGDGRQGSLFRAFRAAAHEGACRFVFSGSRVLYRHLHDAASPFFNFAEEILLRPIDERAVKEIVETPMTQLGIQLVHAPELLSRVIDVTSCHPNLVQILCHRIVQGAVDRRATRELVDRIVDDREFQREFVETAWSESTPREKLVSLLSAEETIATGELQARAQEHGIGNGGVQEALRMLELCSLMAQRPEGITYLLRSFPGMVRRFEDVPALVATLASGGRA